ncbi:MAG: hypothetical protein JWO32_619, partial [Bacteroidetes bacterium]|nr:hypothetical protein [Bacteroidota bacterium]
MFEYVDNFFNYIYQVGPSKLIRIFWFFVFFEFIRFFVLEFLVLVIWRIK